MTDFANGHPREELSEYLDDQLGVPERTAMDRHLASCEDCRGELDALRQLAKAVGEEQVPPLPVDLSARIGRSLDAATVVRFKSSRFVVPATIAATIGAIGILVALQWREGHVVPPESVATEGTLASRQTRPEKETATVDAKDKDVMLADEPVVLDLPKQKKDEIVDGGVVGGAVGALDSDGAAEPAADERRDRALSMGLNESVAAAPPAAAAKSAVASSCLDRWSDSGLRGSWGVPDIDAAERQLGRIAHAVGGNGLWRGVADGRPYVVVVPRDRFEEVFYALRARGVTGLGEPATLAEGTDCTGISITLTVVAGQASPAPR